MKIKQIDLFGFDVPYSCKKCGRVFQTMQDSSKHHAKKHHNKIIQKTSINFTLENYCLITTKITEVIK